VVSVVSLLDVTPGIDWAWAAGGDIIRTRRTRMARID